ncbi:MAG: ABC transporter permease [Lachnospiraceae bacterium]|nr:ABC transporter permease [Lachnospiraceae bacterium]
MSRLLSANFQRLFKSKNFWIAVIFMYLFPTCELIVSKADQTLHPGKYSRAELSDLLFSGTMLLVVVAAVFVSVFIGTEYSDGTMRNKIVSGHKRGHIYLANLVVCTAAVLMMQTAYFLALLLPGVPLFGWSEMPAVELAIRVLLCLPVLICYAACDLSVCMIVHSKTAGAIVTILAAVIFLMMSVSIVSSLREPEYLAVYEPYVEDGTLFEAIEGNEGLEDAVRNEFYVDGTKRMVYEVFGEICPTSQVVQMAFGGIPEHAGRFPLYDAGIVFVTTMAGILVFRSKDLK